MKRILITICIALFAIAGFAQANEELLESEGSLIEFDKLDRTAETLVLIVDNYISILLEETRNSDDILADIRDLKIKKTLRKK